MRTHTLLSEWAASLIGTVGLDMCWASRVTSIYFCNWFVYGRSIQLSLMQHKIGDGSYKFRTLITTGIKWSPSHTLLNSTTRWGQRLNLLFHREGHYVIFLRFATGARGGAVFEALRYKPEGRGFESSGFGGLVVSMLASGTQDRVFAPDRSRRNFHAGKIPQHAFLRRGSKIICPMSQIWGM
jgi:hypothetical protein